MAAEYTESTKHAYSIQKLESPPVPHFPSREPADNPDLRYDALVSGTFEAPCGFLSRLGPALVAR
jgi:hypothetical protein